MIEININNISLFDIGISNVSLGNKLKSTTTNIKSSGFWQWDNGGFILWDDGSKIKL